MVLFRAVVLSLCAAALCGIGGIGGIAACGGKAKPTEKQPDVSEDAGVAEPPIVRRVLHLGLEYFDVAGSEPIVSRVALILTDETGATRREPIGEFPGGCSDVTVAARAEPMKPLMGLDCWAGDAGVQLRFAHRQNKLYVVSAEVERGGAAPEYGPLKTIELPGATPITTDYTDNTDETGDTDDDQ